MTRVPWAFSPGNLIDAKYIDSRYRHLGVRGRVVEVVDEQVYITAGARSQTVAIGVDRFYDVHVVRESPEGVRTRKEAWEVLKATARRLSKVSDWEREEFMQGMRTIMDYFPELKQGQER